MIHRLIKSRQYWFILLIQIVIYFLTPFISVHWTYRVLFAVCMFGTFLVVIPTVWTTQLPRRLSIVAAVIALASGTVVHVPGFHPQWSSALVMICCFSYAIFILIAIISIGKDILFKDDVSLDCVLGSICVYIFIGMFFSFIFAGIGLADPHSINYGPYRPDKPDRLTDFVYFSFSNLTTMGNGDINAARPFAKLLAAFESMIGTLYIAVMISRLVGLHIYNQSLKNAHDGR